MTNPRQNFVTASPPRHRRRRTGTTFPCATFATRLADEAFARWVRWSGHYGSLTGEWVPGLRPPRDKLALLAQSILPRLLYEIAQEAGGDSWDCDLDFDSSDHPIALLVSDAQVTTAVPLALTARALRIGDEIISLASPRAGSRIVDTLAARIAAILAG